MKCSLTATCLAMVSGVSMATATTIDPDWSIARVWDETILDAIRIATPRPPVHGRNLYYNSAAMYDAWAAYDPVARGVFFHEKHTAEDLDAARREAISYASYRVLKARFVAGNGPNIAQIQANLDAVFATLGYDKNFTSTVGNSPAAIGNRVAAAALAAGLADNSNEAGNYAAPSYQPVNPELVFALPGIVCEDADRWVPLAFDFLVLQNGIIIGAAVQVAVCPHWGGVTPFALTALEKHPDTGLYFDQGGPPKVGTAWGVENAVNNLANSSTLDPRDAELIDIGLNVYHNSPLGTYDHAGYPVNPVTGEPYKSNVVRRADFHRAIVELWADGPDSETPPGHWHLIANEASDHPLMEHRLFGDGPIVDRLEWDIKMYLTMSGANHDAAITAWGMKGYYDSARPISFIRAMNELGQASDPSAPRYHPDGLPLIPGLIEQVTEEDVAPGGRFEDLPELVYEPLSGEPIGVNDHVGALVSRAWLGGMYAGTTSGVSATGPLPGHVLRTDSGWQIGDFEPGVDDTPGQPNPGFSGTKSLKISEIRLDQPGNDVDEYFEISGPPGASLDGVWYVVLGDEQLTKVPDSSGRVQVAVDLSGHTLNRNGTFVVAKSANFSLGSPDLVRHFVFNQINNCTHFLVTDYNGYLGLECDWFDDGVLDLEPWSSVLDSIAFKRNSQPKGKYSPVVLGPADSDEQLYGVDWQLIDRWSTYMPSNFVVPPFPGYTSGHSTFSRSAAEVMAGFTGTPYFPGGMATFFIPKNTFKFEKGPSEDFLLEWATYFDGADEAGLSRITSGIHPIADDLPGRISGSMAGRKVVARAKALFQGLNHSPDLNFDGVVDGADLGLFLENWGNVGAGLDLNGDGQVDGADLGVLLSNWS